MLEILIGLFVLLNGLDGATTYIGIRGGKQEANIFVRTLVRYFGIGGGVIISKSAIFPIAVMMYTLGTQSIIGLALIDIYYSYIVIMNLRVINKKNEQ